MLCGMYFAKKAWSNMRYTFPLSSVHIFKFMNLYMDEKYIRWKFDLWIRVYFLASCLNFWLYWLIYPNSGYFLIGGLHEIGFFKCYVEDWVFGTRNVIFFGNRVKFEHEIIFIFAELEQFRKKCR